MVKPGDCVLKVTIEAPDASGEGSSEEVRYHHVPHPCYKPHRLVLLRMHPTSPPVIENEEGQDVELVDLEMDFLHKLTTPCHRGKSPFASPRTAMSGRRP